MYVRSCVFWHFYFSDYQKISEQPCSSGEHKCCRKEYKLVTNPVSPHCSHPHDTTEFWHCKLDRWWRRSRKSVVVSSPANDTHFHPTPTSVPAQTRTHTTTPLLTTTTPNSTLSRPGFGLRFRFLTFSVWYQHVLVPAESDSTKTEGKYQQLWRYVANESPFFLSDWTLFSTSILPPNFLRKTILPYTLLTSSLSDSHGRISVYYNSTLNVPSVLSPFICHKGSTVTRPPRSVMSTTLLRHIQSSRRVW
jgi:hypothetical protein